MTVIGRVKLERVADRTRSMTMVLARYFAKQAVKERRAYNRAHPLDVVVDFIVRAFWPIPA